MKIRKELIEAEAVTPADADKWRVKNLWMLLEQWQEWYYMGEESETKEVQSLIDSLCIN